jgi:hypothetical protein
MASALLFAGRITAEEKMLFDFEDEAGLRGWTPTNVGDLREDARKAVFERLAREKGAAAPWYQPPAPPLAPEPPVKLELAAEHATSGKHSLKLTYAGGRLPTVGTDAVPVADWSGYKTFRADVTASRTCVVVVRVMREGSRRGDDWEGMISRYEEVARLEAGRNEVVDLLHTQAFAKLWKVVRVEISMYAPKEGESIFVDGIRLSTETPTDTSAYSYMNVHYMGEVRAEAPFFPGLDRKIRVLGTDWELTKVTELGDRIQGQWTRPVKRSVEEVEADFRRQYEDLRKAHPRAVMAILRDGEKGYDPARPERIYDGWRDTEIQGHDPGAVYASFLGLRRGARPSSEMFLRRRTFLMKADLSSIPAGSRILKAWFLAVKTCSPDPERLKGEYAWESPLKPAFFVAEACNRDWDEALANGIEYAEGRFWKEICGEYWRGDAPDFPPLVIAYGQAGFDQNVFDFTEAVRWWTSGRHANYGFTMYSFGNYMEFCTVWMRHVSEIRNRPALVVVYEPPQ